MHLMLRNRLERIAPLENRSCRAPGIESRRKFRRYGGPATRRPFDRPRCEDSAVNIVRVPAAGCVSLESTSGGVTARASGSRRGSWPSSLRIEATSPNRSPTGAMSTSTSSSSGTTNCWPSRRRASEQVMCSSMTTVQSWAGSTFTALRRAWPRSAIGLHNG